MLQPIRPCGRPEQIDLERPGDELFLSGWSDEDYGRLLLHTEVRPFRAGEVVIRAGEADRALYVVAAGKLQVLVGASGAEDREPVATLEAGSVVGEQAFLDGLPRSAAVRAVEGGELLRLGVEAFNAFASREPILGYAFLFDLGRILSLRLRRTTERQRVAPRPMRIGIPLQRIQIDQEERARKVAEITGTSFFQELQDRTRRMRREADRAGDSPS